MKQHLLQRLTRRQRAVETGHPTTDNTPHGFSRFGFAQPRLPTAVSAWTILAEAPSIL